MALVKTLEVAISSAVKVMPETAFSRKERPYYIYSQAVILYKTLNSIPYSFVFIYKNHYIYTKIYTF